MQKDRQDEVCVHVCRSYISVKTSFSLIHFDYIILYFDFCM